MIKQLAFLHSSIMPGFTHTTLLNLHKMKTKPSVKLKSADAEHTESDLHIKKATTKNNQIGKEQDSQPVPKQLAGAKQQQGQARC